MEKEKLCCFVDETGQDTKGRFFLVAVVLLGQSVRDDIEQLLESVERKVRKQHLKWKKTPIDVKKAYLREIVRLDGLKQSLFYVTHTDTLQYTYLTSLAVASSVQKRVTGEYFVSIVIDGLKDKEREKMRKTFKGLDIKYKGIRGMKDEQSVFLRLADALAGFVRDYLEGDLYTKDFFLELVGKGFLEEI
jgi:hypothetical protein